MESPTPAHVILELLSSIHRALYANLEERARALGLTVAQDGLMRDLAAHPASTLQEVCDRLGWPKSTVSRLTDELVRKGVVSRAVPAENRRTVLLSLSGSAACISETEMLKGAGAGLTAEEVRTLAASLRRVLSLVQG